MLGWESLISLYKKQKCIMMYKCLNGYSPEYLCNIFTSQPTHAYNTRNGNSIKQTSPEMCRTEAFRKSFLITGANYWNNLPEEFKKSPSLAIFKRKLQTLAILNK